MKCQFAILTIFEIPVKMITSVTTIRRDFAVYLYMPVLEGNI